MTNQEIFDKVAKHLLTQRVQSMSISAIDNFTSICAYRGAEGTSCAVGCLIPDDKYDPSLEGLNIHSIAHSMMASILEVSVEEYRNNTKDLLSALQGIHDMVRPEYWRDELTTLAADRGLEFKE